MVKRILGIDPGSCITGFGILDISGQQISYVTCGCFRLKGKNASEKLGYLLIELKNLIDEYRPTEIAIEAIFLHKNPNSALKLGQARGIALAAAMVNELPVSEYAARQVKLAVTGKGNADKIQVQYMVNQVLKLDCINQADAADALAIALCHAHAQSGWGSMLAAQGVVAFSRRKAARKRSDKWPSYQKETK